MCCETVKTKPISFEVFADDFKEMRCAGPAHPRLAGQCVCEDPGTELMGESSMDLIRDLAQQGV